MSSCLDYECAHVAPAERVYDEALHDVVKKAICFSLRWVFYRDKSTCTSSRNPVSPAVLRPFLQWPHSQLYYAEVIATNQLPLPLLL